MEKQDVNKIKRLQGFQNIDKNQPVYNQIIDSIYKEMIAKINDPNFDAIQPWQLKDLYKTDMFDFKPILKKIANKYRNEKGHTVFGSTIPNDYKFIYDHDIWSNIHWGYTLQKNKVFGRKLGAQLHDALKGHKNVFSDSNTDNNAVIFGMDLYDKYGKNLTKEQFESEIFKHKDELNRWSKKKLILLESREPKTDTNYFDLPQEERIDLIPNIQDEYDTISNPQSSFYYEVKITDSLEKIADDNNISVDELIELNPEIEHSEKVIPFQILIVGDKDAKNLSHDAFQIDNIKHAKLAMQNYAYTNSISPNFKKVNDEITQFFNSEYNDNIEEYNTTNTDISQNKKLQKEKELEENILMFKKLHKKVSEQKENTDIKKEAKIFYEYKIPEIENEEIASDIFEYSVITENPKQVVKTTQSITNKILDEEDELKVDGILGNKTLNALNNLDTTEINTVRQELHNTFKSESNQNSTTNSSNKNYNFDGDNNLLYCPVPNDFYD